MVPNYQYNLGLAFYRVAETFGSKTALRYPDRTSYTYDQVNKLSNRMARYLLDQQVRRGDVVAIFNDKSVEAYSLMLACLKVGIIYTNLDVSSPVPRLVKIISTAAPVMLFHDQVDHSLVEKIGNEFAGMRITPLYSQGFREAVDRLDDSDLQETLRINGSEPVYLMFTSGSTGFPKGAVMGHNNVLNFIKWGQVTFSVTSEDTFTNVNPIYFDNSVFDFYASLFSGATLVPLKGEYLKNSKELVSAINDSGCTIWFSVPSLLVYLLTTKSLTEQDFPRMLRIAFGGEGFPKNKLKQLYDLFKDRITLFNVYGPTECTCICSSYIISEQDFDNMTELAPLGFMAPNFGYEILPLDSQDPDLGELALIGPCVGLGYYNDPERTEKSFVQNPNKQYFQRMYKTGDIVQRAESGYLHFKGRVDNQIKHMGYRIEMEEVEAAFSSLAYVNEVGVIYQRISQELGQIKAFVSLNHLAPEQGKISADIRNLLPPYMVPKSIKILDTLPKNRNGKIDRNQLAEIK